MSDVETVVREHAERVRAGDPQALADLAPDVQLEPRDLFDRLFRWRFRACELVAHARIGAQHVFKTKYVGPTTVVVQARWVRNVAGRWQLVDAEVARLEAETNA